MVVPRLQWPQLPAWMNLTGSKKRALEEEEDNQEEEKMEVEEKVERQQERKSDEPAVKRSKPTPPCAQCRAGIPGHWGHLRQA